MLPIFLTQTSFVSHHSKINKILMSLCIWTQVRCVIYKFYFGYQIKVSKNIHVKIGITVIGTDQQLWISHEWFSLAKSVRSRTMNLFNWLYWSSAFESDPELSVRKLHTLWGCELLELGLRQNVGCNKPFDPRESR